LKEKKIQLTGIAAGQSPSLKLAKVLGRLRVATQEELDWPYLREWNEKARTLDSPIWPRHGTLIAIKASLA